MALVALSAELGVVDISTQMAAATVCRDVSTAAARIAMTVDTLQAQVRAVDRELRMQVVIEARQRPVVAVVAVSALISEAAVVRIISAMAIGTAGRCVVKAIARMAGAAGDRGMQSRQRKRRQVVIEAQGRCPVRLIVAIAALLTELACMRIVHGVAFAAARCHDVHRGGFVTGRAVQPGVSFDESKSGVRMIERGIGPGGRPVTGVALVAVAALMVIFAAVAIDAAAAPRVLEILSPMTVIALQSCVRIGQRKPRRRMIESNSAPRRGGMAVMAGIAFAARVHVVDSVTARAATRRRGKLVVTVTIAALDVDVSARKRVPGLLVVKIRLLPVG